jgi:hypothetical protein
MIIETQTKPNGANNNWLEIGKFEVDKFGDKIWRPNPKPRYPNQSQKLECKREWSGNRGGASEKISWKIIVPDDYKLFIVQRWGDGDIKILYSPEEK